MSSNATSKITDTEKKEKAELLIAKFNENDELLSSFFDEISENYTPRVHVQILKEALELGGVQQGVPSSRKEMLLQFCTPKKRLKGMLEGILAAFELIAKVGFEEDTVLISEFSGMLENQPRKEMCRLNQPEIIDLIKRFTFGGALLRKTLKKRQGEQSLNFDYLDAWTMFLQPLLGVRSVGQGLQPQDAERILEILIGVPRAEIPDQAFLSLPRLAHIAGSAGSAKLMRSSFSDGWGQLVKDASGGVLESISDKSEHDEISPAQASLLATLSGEFARLEQHITTATAKQEAEAERYTLLNDRKNDLEREFHAEVRDRESKIHGLKLELKMRADERDKLATALDDVEREKFELSKEIDQLQHQGQLSDEIKAQSDKDELRKTILRPIENMRGLISTTLERKQDIKELKAIASELERFVKRLERKFDLSLGNKIQEDLYSNRAGENDGTNRF